MHGTNVGKKRDMIDLTVAGGSELSVFSLDDAKRKHYIDSFGKALFGVAEGFRPCSYLGLKGVSWKLFFA